MPFIDATILILLNHGSWNALREGRLCFDLIQFEFQTVTVWKTMSSRLRRWRQSNIRRFAHTCVRVQQKLCFTFHESDSLQAECAEQAECDWSGDYCVELGGGACLSPLHGDVRAVQTNCDILLSSGRRGNQEKRISTKWLRRQKARVSYSFPSYTASVWSLSCRIWLTGRDSHCATLLADVQECVGFTRSE